MIPTSYDVYDFMIFKFHGLLSFVRWSRVSLFLVAGAYKHNNEARKHPSCLGALPCWLSGCWAGRLVAGLVVSVSLVSFADRVRLCFH